MESQTSQQAKEQQLTEADLNRSATLQTIIRKGKVRLLRASWLVEQANHGLLQTLNRQSLEASYPEAYTDEKTLQRGLREVEASAEASLCVYPALVMVSFCWQTSEHPDPSGHMLLMLVMFLNWYAAQRTKFTRERLYGSKKMKGVDFDADFNVFIDFWSIYQNPRTPEQGGNYLFAKKWMNVMYGHRGTAVLVVSTGPEARKDDPDYEDRGGYEDRGWCVFERAVSSLCKVEGHCLDLGGFNAMLSSFKLPNSHFAALKTPFGKKGKDELEALALDDRNGTAEEGSCLQPMVAGKQLPLQSPTDLEMQLIFLKWGNKTDTTICAEGYQAVVSVVLQNRTEQRCAHMLHWTPKHWKQLGGAMLLCSSLTLLDLHHCPNLADDGLEVFAAALHRSSAPQLLRINLTGSNVGARGCLALAKALSRGALPALQTVAGIGDVLAQVQRISEAAGPDIAITYSPSAESLSIARNETPSAIALSLSPGPGSGEGFELTPQASDYTTADSVSCVGAEAGPGVMQHFRTLGGKRLSGEAPSGSDIRVDRMQSMEVEQSHGWDLLKHPKGRSRSTSPPMSGSSKEQWVDMAMERQSSFRQNNEQAQSKKCTCSVS